MRREDVVVFMIGFGITVGIMLFLYLLPVPHTQVMPMIP